MTFDAALSGFALSFSLILAIGAQNAFVLRQGLRREHVLPVVLTCAISDAVLIAIGVVGFGGLAATVPGFETVMRYGGAAFLVVYGAMSFRRAFQGGEALMPTGLEVRALGPVLTTCLALTWLNPHVYLDTVVLIGSVSAGFEGARPAFAVGAMSASLVFFSLLGFGARWLSPIFARPIAWQLLEIVVGGVMWAIALGLVLGA